MTTSTKPGTREVVEAAYQALSSGDVPTFLGLLADDVTLHEPDNHPAPGLLTSKQEVVAALEGLVAGLGLRGVVVHEILTEGERAVGIIDVECTAGSGREYSMSVVELWTVRDGLVRAIKPHYFDTAALVAASQE
jgi:ketosteroid isomerase-like protein